MSGARRPSFHLFAGVPAGLDELVGGSNHLHHQGRVQRLHHVDVGVESEGVHPAGIAGDIALEIVGPADRQEQLNVGPEPPFAGFTDHDAALGRHRAPLLPMGVRSGHGQIDRG